MADNYKCIWYNLNMQISEKGRRRNMALSYKPLWHLLIEKNMNREDLKRAANITSNIIARMGKDLYVDLKTIEKICLALDCRIEDVVEIKKR